MGDTKPIWLFYHLQNEKGESSAHPNACKVTTATPGRVTLQDVLDCFPLAGTSSFHFRFQVSIDKVPMFLDLTNPGDTVPTSNGNIIAKVLRLGACGRHTASSGTLEPWPACSQRLSFLHARHPAHAADTAPCATKNSYGLRLRSGAAEARAALAAGRAPAADAAPPPRSASIRVPGGAASAPATGGSGAVASPAGTVGGVPTLKPVKTVEVDLDVEAPEVVDDDLKDKSAYVQKMVSWPPLARWKRYALQAKALAACPRERTARAPQSKQRRPHAATLLCPHCR